MVIKCLCFDGVKNSENCTFRFRKLYVSFLRLYQREICRFVIARAFRPVAPDERSMRRDRLRAMPCKEEDNKRSAVNLKRTNKKCINSINYCLM